MTHDHHVAPVLPTVLSSTPVPKGDVAVNLTIWLPAMFLLGLLTLGVMFAFTAACDKV